MVLRIRRLWRSSCSQVVNFSRSNSSRRELLANCLPNLVGVCAALFGAWSTQYWLPEWSLCQLILGTLCWSLLNFRQTGFVRETIGFQKRTGSCLEPQRWVGCWVGRWVSCVCLSGTEMCRWKKLKNQITIPAFGRKCGLKSYKQNHETSWGSRTSHRLFYFWNGI